MQFETTTYESILLFNVLKTISNVGDPSGSLSEATDVG